VQLKIFRSARAEDLVGFLAESLRADSQDPFDPVPIVVGSRGMERWLRHELATRLDIAANLVFPFPRQALDGLATTLLAESVNPDRAYWQRHSDDAFKRWQPDALSFAVIPAIRQRVHLKSFSDVKNYLKLDEVSGPSPVEFREMAFAREVADVLDKLLHERHAEALGWAEDPTTAGPHQWLGQLLAAVGAGDADSPAQVRAALLNQRGQPVDGLMPLRLFCLSTLGPADREILFALSRRVLVELYLLVPSHKWWEHIRSRREQWRSLEQASSPEDYATVQAETASHNSLLASLGIPSRDLQGWLETLDYDEPVFIQTPKPARTDLERLQQWVGEAGDTEELRESGLKADGSIALHKCWGAQRQVEVLRDELLHLFQTRPGEIEPRDVLVMTPDIETFAPLVSALFARRGPMVPLHEPLTTSAGHTQSPRAHDEYDDYEAYDEPAPGLPLKARWQSSQAAQLPAIPVSIADLGLVRINPVAEVLLAVLALADGRVSAPNLYALLSLEPVRLRFDLSVEDVADVRTLIEESGMRWAIDPQERQQANQPALFQNTLDFGFERLALGAMMADPDPLQVLEVDAVSGSSVVPLPMRNADRVARAAALGRVVNAVRALRQRQQSHSEGRGLLAWHEECLTIVQDFVRTADKSAWLTAQVRQELAKFVGAGESFTGTLTLTAIRRSLQGHFDQTVKGDRVLTGAVTVCSLQPMRSVPFKVIALLGMDDGVFPRARTRRAWDPLSQPKPGEIDQRLAQRHLLLETLLSVRDTLLFFWNGHGQKPEEDFPPAVPVSELYDLLAAASDESIKHDWVTAQPLQPWSPQAFKGRCFTYSKALADAAVALGRAQQAKEMPQAIGLAATDPANCMPEANPPTGLTLDELAHGLTNAAELFLRERLQVTIPKDKDDLEGREPLELDSLDQWSVRKQAMQMLLEKDGADSAPVINVLMRRLQAEGHLPLEAGGRHFVRRVCEETRALLDAFAEVKGVATAKTDPLRLELTVPWNQSVLPVYLSGEPLTTRTHDGVTMLERLTPSKSEKPELQLSTWLYLLAARAAGHDVQQARLVGHKDAPSGRSKTLKQIAGFLLATSKSPTECRTELESLVGIWLRCRSRPLPLFAKTSRALAEAVLNNTYPLTSVRKAWGSEENDGGWSAGEGSFAIHRALFAGWDPSEHLTRDNDPDSFSSVAMSVFGSMLEAFEEGKINATHFSVAAAPARPNP